MFRKLIFLGYLVLTIILIISLNVRINDIPPIGKFLNPYSGFWINGESKVGDNFKKIINQPIKKVPSLRDVTIANLFFENSTRTKLSFEIAEKRLSADILNFASGASSVKKGETLLDTVNNILAMKVDMVVMRHPNPGASVFLSRNVNAIIINAGDGNYAHPTQGLLDVFTMSEVVDLNIKASFDIAQLSTKIMLKSKNRKKIGGSIINLSSQLGKVGAPLRSVYNMTKFGIEGLTKGMAIDLAKHNIRVNSICPTFVETPMVKKFFKNKDFKKSVIKNIPLGKVATESDIATAVVYLASDASSMMTGSSLVIDGGWTAK